MTYFNIIAATNENTVVTEYKPVKSHSEALALYGALFWASKLKLLRFTCLLFVMLNMLIC